MLRYGRLSHALFSDTLISGSVSKHVIEYAQMYGVSFSWAQAFPMAKKGDTYENLNILLKRDGVPPKTIVDGSKEQISGKFIKKLR